MKVAIRVPGKLYLAGEYAVVEAGYPAVIAALDQTICVTMESAETGTIFSSQNPQLLVDWTRKNAKIHCHTSHPYALVESAMQTTEDYLASQRVEVNVLYKLSISSELDNEQTGQKYGLGSSGAVTVAVVQAVLTFFGQDARPDLVYKLSVLAQVSLGMKGSFGDIAASSFGGVIAYHSVDRSWLFEKMVQLNISELIEQPWVGLAIESLDLPRHVEMMVGWTGAAASTADLVSHVQGRLNEAEKEVAYQGFLVASRDCVEQLIAACRLDDVQKFQLAISENRALLRQFAEDMEMVIETETLETLCRIAERYQAAAKSSGAGGGDCGICFVEKAEQKEAIITAWAQEKIQVLPLSIAARQ